MEGCAIVSGCFHHYHDLVESQGDSLPEASLRQIPEEFISIGHELKRAVLTVIKINQVFVIKTHEQNKAIT